MTTIKRRSPRQPALAPPVLRIALTDEQRIERAECIAASTQRLFVSARELGMTVTGDWRVGASDAAKLLDLPEGTLANYRCQGDGPVFHKIGRHVYYGLRDLAIWLWACRHDSSSQGFM